MPPIALTDDELDVVMRAATPIDHDRRGAFLEAVAAELAGQRELGEGVVFRICREQQRKFYDAPMQMAPTGRRTGVGKYYR